MYHIISYHMFAKDISYSTLLVACYIFILNLQYFASSFLPFNR